MTSKDRTGMLQPPTHRTAESLSVALLSTARQWRGGEQQASFLAHGLRRLGHTCHIFAPAGQPLAERMKQDGFEVTPLVGRGRNPLAAWQIRRVLKRQAFDVLHLNDAHAVTIGCWAGWGQDLLRVAARRVAFPIRSVTKYQRCADVVVCVSRAVADVCRQSGLSSKSLRVVLDGVEVDPSRSDRQRVRAALGLDDRHLLLLNVAALDQQKGQRFLLDALPGLVQRFPDLRVAVAGDGPQHEQLQDQIQQLGLRQNVQLLGFRQDVPDLVRAADLFVMPSLMEGLCSALIEAMVAGVPVVASRAGGMPELMQPDVPHQGPLGWLVPPADTESLRAAILEALQNPAERRRRAAAARAVARTYYSHQAMVDATLAVYREQLAAR